MAGERRTRVGQSQTQIQNQGQLTYSYRASEVTKHFPGGVKKSNKPVAVVDAKSTATITDLFAYDIKLIYQDLLKTVIIMVLILAAVVGIKFGMH